MNANENSARPVAFSSTHFRAVAGLLALALSLSLTACGGTEADALAAAAADSAATPPPPAPGPVTAGANVSVNVTLPSTARSGSTVYLSFPRTVLAGPRFVRMTKDQRSAVVTFQTNPYLATTTTAAILANTQNPDPASSWQVAVTVVPAAAAPSATRPNVASVTFSPSTVTSGQAATGTVTLTSAAPAGGAAVQLFNSTDFFNQVAGVPFVVLVPGGATSASFQVATRLPAGGTGSAVPVAGSYFGGTTTGSYLTIVP